jgi:sulfate transport system ATP-binding protein
VRPHDLSVSLEPTEGGREAQVSRVVHLGFEVRVELELADEGQVSVQLTKAEAELLELAPGDIVYVSASPNSPGPLPASPPSAAASPPPGPPA